ncbi:MAG: DUF5016 domain-containing protein [Mangrovibacterium sp.]
MKTHKILGLFIVFAGFLVSCSDDDGDTTISLPSIESLAIEGDETILLSDSLYFNAKVSDNIRPLSTLEVEVIANEEVISSKSIRTKGNSVELEHEAIAVPFLPDIETGDDLTVNFTLINVDGGEAKEQKTLKAKRPELPGSLYLILSDKSVIELKANGENPYVYESEEGTYASTFNTKIATAQDPEDAEYVWNAGREDNLAAIGDRFGTDIKFAFSNWLVKKIFFNALTFRFDIEGINLIVKLKGIQLAAAGDYLYASIDFEKDEEFEITGIEDLEGAFNRDFFEYDPGTGKCKFIGESGKWDIYYSLSYNYIWVNRMSDVAPAAYWIIGAGLSSSPRWHSDFNSIGWDLDDVKQVAYMKPLGSGKYQATIYLSDQVPWGFDIQIFSNRTWNAQFAVFADDRLTGDSTGMHAAGGSMTDIVMGDGFIPGYYRLTMDLSGGLDQAKVEFERISQ